MIDRGESPADIARVLNVAPQTVREWRRYYRAGGRAALASGRATGRPPKLTEKQRARLAELLVNTPAECGFTGRHLWTQQLIADLILREFGVTFHHDHVGIILKSIGFTHQKPARRYIERDEAAIDAWRRQTWQALLKKASTPAG
jgi:transposase